MNDRVREMRRAFDESFAEAPGGDAVETEDLLAIRVAGDAYALRLRDVRGLLACPSLAPLPGRRGEVTGLAAVKGALLPVFSLARLLGYDGDRGLWLAVVGREEPAAVAFDRFESMIRLSRSELCAPDNAAGARPFVMHVVRVAGASRGVVDLAAIGARIRKEE